MNRAWWIGLAVALISPVVKASEPGVLIRDGKGHATIVVPHETDAVANLTATDLQDVLGKMTGVKLPIQPDDKQISGNRILVGQTRWTDAVVSPKERTSLGKEGFILRRKERDIALSGGGPWGVAYAASELFERLGARWYFPGRLGEVIPKLTEVRFDDLDVRQVPSFRLRWLGRDFNWKLRNRTNAIKDDSLPRGYIIEPSIFHSQSKLIPHEIYDKTHPEFFALIDGKRSRDPNCKLCNSNPDLPREIARRLGEILRANPGIEMVSLSPTDHMGYCECADCRALDEPDVPNDQKYSRRQMVLYNRVAQELEKDFPDTLLLGGAYHIYTWPPKDPTIKAHRNLAVVICHYNKYCLAHPVNDPKCEPNRRYSELIAAWQKHTSHICFYEYYDKFNWMDLPWPIVHSVAEDIPYFKSQGFEGLYTQCRKDVIWSTFLVHYVAARLLWDHTTDVQALLDDFYVKFYGRAASPMKAYHETLERRMAEHGRHISGGAPWNAPPLFTPEIVTELRGYLDEAASLADDKLVKARVERTTCLLDYTERLVDVFRLWWRATHTKGPQRRPLLQETLDNSAAIRDEILANPRKYTGVTRARGFIGRQQFARAITSIEQELQKKQP